MNILLTGGAGYIGSHVADLARHSGHHCWVVDDLSTGLLERVPEGVVQLNLSEPKAEEILAQLMKDNAIDAVIHLAARKQVGQSVEMPEFYFQDNVGGMATLLNAMRTVGVKKMVFSSSAATYGMPNVEKVTEETECKPINPYGQTKLIGEWMVKNAKVWGLKSSSLRYFNVAGATSSKFADTAALNLIPIIIEAVRAGKPVSVFGDTYPTSDGSCIRDYVHVADLARAHLASLESLEAAKTDSSIYNVGTGVGASVFDVINGMKAIIGEDFPVEVKPPRAGDPPRLVADVAKIERELGFKAEFGLTDILESAWRFS
ncbi:MAG: hypothetical protein RL068_449 [Actinomycetota bacterium]